MKHSGWLAAGLMMAGLAVPLSAQQIQISKDNRTIAISTSDDASAMADTAVVSVGFQAYGKDQTDLYADATKTSGAIVAALTAAGVPKTAIESTDQGLHPLEPNGDENKQRYTAGLRFQFNQDWRVTVPADLAAKVLQLAVAAGANNSGNIDWQLKEDDTLEAEAASKALAHAREIAESMAKGLGVRLGGLVYASNQTPPRGIFAANGFGNVEMNMPAAAQRVSLERKLGPLAITPQRISKSATVYAVFAIE